MVLAGRGQGVDLALDFNALPPQGELVRRLRGHDVLVNAVGIFQAQAQQSFDAVHVKAVAALFGAAVQAGIGRLLHVSALGAELGGSTAYFDSKGRAEVLLRQLPAPVVIVRPSLVFSPQGASSRFFLGLA
ncbi:putative NAD(P)-binding protein, partial [Pseudoxanthomonas taiwanensis J19]